MGKLKTNQTGFGVVECVLIIFAIGIIVFVGWYIYHSNKKATSFYNSAANSSASSTTTQKSTTTNWQKYTDSVINFQYPQSVKVTKVACPPSVDSCVSAKVSTDTGQGSIFYEKASALSAKNYAMQNYSSDGTKVKTSNNNPINGFDTYSASTTQTLSGKTYTFWETYITHNGEVAYSNYPTGSSSAAVYKEIVSTLKLVN